ncbi:MAG: hypothetical protein IPM95_06350 [Sphingobacteriales bacterium]|nr:hypothetical protein [Sphingobacteriales bacterium]
MKKIILLIGAWCMAVPAISEEIPCGTVCSPEYAQQMKKSIPEFEEFKSSFERNMSPTGRIMAGLKKNSIPIKIHIVRNNSGFTALDTSFIRKGINYINKQFLNSGLEFYVCGSYNYINNSIFYNLNNSEYSPLNNTFGIANVINLYMVDTLTIGGSNAQGVAPTPGGGLWIMIKNNSDTTVYAHEMGHFFGLLHTHGYSNIVMTNEFVDGSNCHDAGDFICDTPADPRLAPEVNDNPRVNSQCQYYAGFRDGHNQLYTPDVSNIMSYAPHRCVAHFSNDQLAYMNWVYINRRYNLTCSSVNVNFNNTTTQSCDSPYVYHFQNQSVGVSDYQWDVNDDGTTDYTSANPDHTYTSPGVKWVSLSATSGGKTFMRYKPIDFIVPNKVPRLDDFNNSSSLPNGWKLFNPDWGRSWELAQIMGPNGRLSNSLRFRNYNFLAYESEDAVVTNAYDLRNFKNARITFDVAYAPHNNTDTLLVYASTDCGNSYPYLIQKLYGSSLQTHPKQFQEFIPTEDDWKNVVVSLNTYVNNFISFKIVNYNKGGNNVYIDNIRVEGGDSTLGEIGFARTLLTTSENSSSGQLNCRGFRVVSVPVFIASAPTAAITVNITATGTAENIHDYELMTSQVIFPSGQTAFKTVNVKIFDDAAAEGLENIILSLSIQGNTTYKTTNRNRTSTISISDNDTANPEQKMYSSVLLSENFNNMTSDAPAGWTIIATFSQSYTQWMSSSYWAFWIYDPETHSNSVSVDSTNYMMVPTTYSGANNETTYLITPSLNLTAYDSVVIDFDHVLSPYMPYNGDIVVDLWNGNSWINKYTHTTLQGKIGEVNMPEHLTVSATDFNNMDFKVRFGVVNETNSNFYILDNVKITGFKTKARIATALNSSSTVYLGPNQLVNFYDSGTGNIIATIQNQSTWNYGCTTVSINRNGNGVSPYLDLDPVYYATHKTLLITPEFNNPNGMYDITLYYNKPEIDGWTGGTGNPLSEIGMVKSGGAIANVSPGNPYANGTTNYAATNVFNQSYLTGDYKISGRFTQGFSGFALAKTTSNNLLPVVLTQSIQAVYVKDTGNLISWTTAQEYNCDFFEIQHSTDGKKFSNIHKLDGQGNSIIPHEYNFTDVNYSSGRNYYRYHQVDYGGKSTYSDMVMVNNSGYEIIAFEVFPNPVEEQLNLIFQE